MSKLMLAVAILLSNRLAEAEPSLGIALKGGISAARFNSEDPNYKHGFAGGASGTLQWPLQGRFSLGGQLELVYMPRGEDFDGGGTSREHYLDVAAAIRPSARFGSIGVYLLVGCSWDVLLSAHVIDSLGRKTNITDEIPRNDLALLAGGGVVTHLPAQRLGPFQLDTIFLEARYNHGLLDIAPNEAIVTKNRATAVMVGLSFVLGSKPE